MNKARIWEFAGVPVVILALGILFAPSASADTLFIGVSAPTSCGGATMCSGGSAYSVADLLGGTESLPSSFGTYLLDNDIPFMGTYQFTISVLLPFNDGLECEVSGLIDGAATACSISGALGTAGSGVVYGPPSGLSSGTWNPDATLTFSNMPTCGTIADACMFDLTIGTATAKAPEPSSFVLLGMGFAGLFGLAYGKSAALRFGFRP